jgi:hypothetical protein
VGVDGDGVLYVVEFSPGGETELVRYLPTPPRRKLAKSSTAQPEYWSTR